MSTKEEKTLAKEGLLEPELVFNIDKNLLDEEWLHQPKLYFKWAVQLENARADLDEAKIEFDLVKAEVDLNIRNAPDKYDLPGKITEKMVAATLLTTEEYKEVQNTFFTAKYRVGILQAAVAALDHRKKALEKLVDLHGQKYFAAPRASERSREAIEIIEKRAARQKTKAGKRRRRRRDRD